MSQKQMNELDGLPPFMFGIQERLERECAAISYAERNNLQCFNTAEYLWCYFDQVKNKLYDMYCREIDIDALAYLIRKGLMDAAGNKLKDSDIEQKAG